MAAHSSAKESVKCSWNELNSTHNTSLSGSTAACETALPMLPTAGAVSPHAVSMADVISVVEVFPLVPVMPIHGAGLPVRRESTRSLQASSTSEYTGMPRRCASRMNGVLGVNTGEVITRSIRSQSISSKECRSASGLCSSTLITDLARPLRTSTILRPDTPSPATRTVLSAIDAPPLPVSPLNSSFMSSLFRACAQSAGFRHDPNAFRLRDVGYSNNPERVTQSP